MGGWQKGRGLNGMGVELGRAEWNGVVTGLGGGQIRPGRGGCFIGSTCRSLTPFPIMDEMQWKLYRHCCIALWGVK